MNGLEMPRPYFGCDVFAAGNTRIASIRAEGETCRVMLEDNKTEAVLYSDGPGQGFHIQFPLRGLTIGRHYPYASHDNPFLKLARGGVARAT